jgi:4-diphosphocytidyl-2C-methyl-D-erythritol kinase
VNGFDGAADRVYPQFSDLRARLHEVAGQPFHLTGAGPTLYSIFAAAPDARAAARRIGRAGIQMHVARTVARQPAIRASHL